MLTPSPPHTHGALPVLDLPMKPSSKDQAAGVSKALVGGTLSPVDAGSFEAETFEGGSVGTGSDVSGFTVEEGEDFDEGLAGNGDGSNEDFDADARVKSSDRIAEECLLLRRSCRFDESAVHVGYDEMWDFYGDREREIAKDLPNSRVIVGSKASFSFGRLISICSNGFV